MNRHKYINNYVAATIQRPLSRRRWAVRAAVKVRNQTHAIISQFLSDGTDPARNGERLLARLIGPNLRTVVDVGANVGSWLAEVWPYMSTPKRAVAFEPSRQAAGRLRSRFKSEPNLDIVHKAVCDQEGTVQFFEEADSGETSSTVPGVSRRDAVARSVDSTTLDAELFHRDAFESVDFVKIDAEGGDYHVLLGASELLAAGRIRTIQFEYNASWAPAGATLARATRLLESRGFEIYLLKRHGLYQFDYSEFGEFFGYSNFVAVSESSKSFLVPIMRGPL